MLDKYIVFLLNKILIIDIKAKYILLKSQKKLFSNIVLYFF